MKKLFYSVLLGFWVVGTWAQQPVLHPTVKRKKLSLKQVESQLKRLDNGWYKKVTRTDENITYTFYDESKVKVRQIVPKVKVGKERGSGFEVEGDYLIYEVRELFKVANSHKVKVEGNHYTIYLVNYKTGKEKITKGKFPNQSIIQKIIHRNDRLFIFYLKHFTANLRNQAVGGDDFDTDMPINKRAVGLESITYTKDKNNGLLLYKYGLSNTVIPFVIKGSTI